MTLAAFKRALAPGVRITTIEHHIPEMNGKTRTVTRVQTNAYRYVVDGEKGECCTQHPKASDIEFDGTIARVKTVRGAYWTLRIETAK